MAAKHEPTFTNFKPLVETSEEDGCTIRTIYVPGWLQPSFEDFEPLVETLEEDGCSILALYLPGFSKEQIRVQIISSTRKVKISGEQPYRNNAQQRFSKKFRIPPNCDADNITVKYKGDTLHVRLPLRPESKPPLITAPTAAHMAEAREKNRGIAAKRVRAKSTRKVTRGNRSYNNANMITSFLKREGIYGVLVMLSLVILVLLLLFLIASDIQTSSGNCLCKRGDNSTHV